MQAMVCIRPFDVLFPTWSTIFLSTSPLWHAWTEVYQLHFDCFSKTCVILQLAENANPWYSDHTLDQAQKYYLMLTSYIVNLSSAWLQPSLWLQNFHLHDLFPQQTVVVWYDLPHMGVFIYLLPLLWHYVSMKQKSPSQEPRPNCTKLCRNAGCKGIPYLQKALQSLYETTDNRVDTGKQGEIRKQWDISQYGCVYAFIKVWCQLHIKFSTHIIKYWINVQ